jgi:hypothetical protein
MRLPNADRAHVAREKIVGYLLNENHPDGQHKAAVFQQFGFRDTNWRVLARALRNHAFRHEVSDTKESPYGVRYAIDGLIDTPSTRSLNVRTVWIVETNTIIPRLITAYPLG